MPPPSPGRSPPPPRRRPVHALERLGRRRPCPSDTDTAPSSSGVKFRSDVAGYDHRRPLLQGAEQHRHPRRPPLDRRRHPAGHRHLHQRDGHRLAAGRLRHPGRHRRQHHLRRLLLRPGGRLRRRRRLLRQLAASTTARCTPCPDGGRRRQRRLPLRRSGGFPTSTYNATNYWVDRRVPRVRPGGHDPADGHRQIAGGRRDRRLDRLDGHRDLQRADQPGTVSHSTLRDPAGRRRGAAHLRRHDQHRHAHPHRRARRPDHLHRQRSAAPRTSPATS